MLRHSRLRKNISGFFANPRSNQDLLIVKSLQYHTLIWAGGGAESRAGFSILSARSQVVRHSYTSVSRMVNRAAFCAGIKLATTAIMAINPSHKPTAGHEKT